MEEQKEKEKDSGQTGTIPNEQIKGSDADKAYPETEESLEETPEGSDAEAEES